MFGETDMHIELDLSGFVLKNGGNCVIKSILNKCDNFYGSSIVSQLRCCDDSAYIFFGDEGEEVPNLYNPARV